MADNDDDHVHGFAMRLPSGTFDALTGMGERRRIYAEGVELEAWEFLDGLNVKQLLGLRRILDDESCRNNYIDGQVVSILRLVHRVDVTSGEPFGAGLLDDAGTE